MPNPIIDALKNIYPLAVPEIALIALACLLYLAGTWRRDRDLWGTVALVALASVGVVLWYTVPTRPPTAAEVYAAPIILDRLALLTKVITLIGGAILVIFTWYDISDKLAAEFYGCMLLILAGIGLTAMSNDLIALFLSLELISIPTYVMLYIPRRDDLGREAATKYFLLSVFSSGILLFGFSYLYGIAGSTNLSAIMDALRSTQGVDLPVLVLVALVMVVAGLGFKITAVPFHFYAPDVYQGTTASMAALLAFLPKVAGFVALARVLGFVVPAGPAAIAFGPHLPKLLWIVAAVTMTLGNVLALLQTNLKRLLAYSSIAHAGYMLMGLTVAQSLEATNSNVPGGVEAIMFYLVAYGGMTIGAFAVFSYLSTPEREVEMEDDLAGLGVSHPGVALLMTLFLFSLIGVPLTAGFVGKMMLFFGALSGKGDSGVLFRWLAAIMAVNAAIGAWYYLRIIAKMYLHRPVKPLPKTKALPKLMTLWSCALVTLVFGIYPKPLVDLAARTTPRLASNQSVAKASPHTAINP